MDLNFNVCFECLHTLFACVRQRLRVAGVCLVSLMFCMCVGRVRMPACCVHPVLCVVLLCVLCVASGAECVVHECCVGCA